MEPPPQMVADDWASWATTTLAPSSPSANAASLGVPLCDALSRAGNIPNSEYLSAGDPGLPGAATSRTRATLSSLLTLSGNPGSPTWYHSNSGGCTYRLCGPTY